MKKTIIVRNVVITRRVVKRSVPVAQKIVKNLAISSATDVIIHHKLPQMSTVIDVATSYCLCVALKIISHS